MTHNHKEATLFYITIPNAFLGLELRHLVALQAVAEARSFGRAADRLGYTQSAISQQIAMLERIVGQRLFERPGGSRPVSLTQAGQVLLRHAAAIVARLHAAETDLQETTNGASAYLRVGSYQSVGARILPTLLRRFASSWPNLEIQLRECPSDSELLRLIEGGELDVAFVMLPIKHALFEMLPLFQDPYVLMVRADWEVARNHIKPTLSDVASMPLIGHNPNRCQRRIEGALCGGGGARPRVVVRTDDNATVQRLVAEGLGCALVPALAVDPKDDSVTFLRTDPQLPPRVIGAAWHRNRTMPAPALAFLEEARRVCAELALQMVFPVEAKVGVSTVL